MTSSTRHSLASVATAAVLLAGCAGDGSSSGAASTSSGSTVTVPATTRPSAPATPDAPTMDPSVTSPTSSTVPGPSSSPAPAADVTAPDGSSEYGIPSPGPAWTLPSGEQADLGGAGLDDLGDGIRLAAGSATCGWEDATLLHLPWPPDGDGQVADTDDLRQYVWDPTEQLEPLGITRDRMVTAVPPHATDTGFRTAHQHLWLGDDAAEFAYLVADTGEVRRLERPVVKPAGILACG